MNNIIEIKNLNKSFKDVKAVQDLSFRVKEGELFAFLGLNGAGKSTTISIICGQLKKDSGSVTVNGFDLDKNIEGIKSELGVVFQNSVLDKPLSVKSNLENRAALYGITGADFEKRLSELSRMLDLQELLNRPVGKLSGGQRRRVDIARALLHNPKILILDDSTSAVDTATEAGIRTALRSELPDTTKIIIAQRISSVLDADKIIVMDDGRITGIGTHDELIENNEEYKEIYYSQMEKEVK